MGGLRRGGRGVRRTEKSVVKEVLGWSAIWEWTPHETAGELVGGSIADANVMRMKCSEQALYAHG
jgi:hypothetical protein